MKNEEIEVCIQVDPTGNPYNKESTTITVLRSTGRRRVTIDGSPKEETIVAMIVGMSTIKDDQNQ